MIILRQKEFGLFSSFKENRELRDKLEQELPREYYKLEEIKEIIDKRQLPYRDNNFIYNRDIVILDMELNIKWYDKNTDSYKIGTIIDSLFSEDLGIYLLYSFSHKKYYIQIGDEGEIKQVNNLKQELSKLFTSDGIIMTQLDKACRYWKENIYEHPDFIEFLQEISQIIKNKL
jgi:hypothetical protein